MGNNIFTNKNEDSANIINYTRFNGFYDNVYKEHFVTGSAFVFVTKPLLFIEPRKPNATNMLGELAYINMTRDPKFVQFLAEQSLNSLDSKIVESLSYNMNYAVSNFLPIFTNECKSFDLQDVIMEQSQAFETKQGFHQPLPTHNTQSVGAGSLSISVTEDMNLTFTKMMTLWVNYISNITDGTFDANPEMILNGTLDYTSSIYYFVLGPDGKSLKYWAKYTGCWPTSIPLAGLRYAKGSQELVDMDILFAYTTKEDMNPKILEDFNKVSLKLTGSAIGTEYIIDNKYSSVTESPLLNKDQLKRYIPNGENLLKADQRDPIILFKKGNTSGIGADQTSDHFELVFDDNGYHSQFIDTLFENTDYYINDLANNTAKIDEDTTRYDMTSFWAQENIE